MWAELIAAIFAVLALLFLPGYFIARSLGASRIFSLCLAPAISPGLYAVLGVLLYLTGIKADGFTVFLPLIVMSMLIYLVRLIRVKKGTSTTGAPLASHPMDSLTFQGTSWMPILYICTGILAGWYIFLSSLDTPLSCFQVYDNVFHLNYIRASFESGTRNGRLLLSWRYAYCGSPRHESYRSGSCSCRKRFGLCFFVYRLPACHASSFRLSFQRQ